MADNEINADNIRLVAKTIREHKDQFDLARWVDHVNGIPDGSLWRIPSPLHDCGTVCCICGFANALASTPAPYDGGIYYNDTVAATVFLGLPYSFARSLFMPPATCGESIHASGVAEMNPWRQAARLRLVPEEVDIYELQADTVAGVLDAIADGRIKVCEVDTDT